MSPAIFLIKRFQQITRPPYFPPLFSQDMRFMSILGYSSPTPASLCMPAGFNMSSKAERQLFLSYLV